MIGAAAGAAILARVVLPAGADNTVVITGNTSAGENQPGWLFNRDITTATPFEFNTDQASIGTGSLYVMPIGANASDKFIGENFVNTPIANINSITYDFQIGSGGDANDEEHFYMNVYANFGSSPDDKFYDCRYNVVPTTGSTASFTTVTFDPSLAYPVTQSGTSPFACPSIPNDMDSESVNSTIRVFALNVGDTSINDQGLDGYLDKVIVNLDDSSGITTYDFEPFQPTGDITNPVADGDAVSGVFNFMANYNDGDALNDDAVQWAIRSGTCAAGVGTVAGNVDGFTDPFLWDGAAFSASVDTTGYAPGSYCFVFNPTDDAGQNDVRETRNFVIAAPTPTPDPFAVPAECVVEGVTYGAPIMGTNGSNVINGTSGNDLIFALGGSDVVNGKAGHDCIVGGNGSDAIHGDNGNDVILGGEGSDAIQGDAGHDWIYGQDGSDSLKGAAGNDHLFGGNGSDSLKGDGGTDNADGGNNSDACNAETETTCEA